MCQPPPPRSDSRMGTMGVAASLGQMGVCRLADWINILAKLRDNCGASASILPYHDGGLYG